VSREAQTIVLLLLGGALVHAGVTDLYLRYVKAELLPLLLAAGVVLVLVAVATAWYDWRGSRQGERNAVERARHDEHDERGHAHREPRISWLLLLPLLALSLVVPPALGSYSAMNSGTALGQALGSPAGLPADGPLHLSVVDYARRAVFEQGRLLADRPITLTGFVTIGRDGQPYLTRMVLNCCAADAQPVKVGMSGQLPPVLQPDTWFAVTGTYTGRQGADPINNGPIPFIDISRADPVPVPADPYENW
jgi:uncharacterized repeat protein (TIGR03943 family)